MDELWGTFCYLPVEDGLTYLESLGHDEFLDFIDKTVFQGGVWGHGALLKKQTIEFVGWNVCPFSDDTGNLDLVGLDRI